MISKESLKKEFSKDYKKYYEVKLFRQEGFVRKKCATCNAFFWTLDHERKTCPNPPCSSYEFIGNPIGKKMSYLKTWEAIKKFFVKNGHTAVDSYPVVCRWFPGLYFTIASIVAFQRSLNGKTVFEMPANPLVIPQACLRFNDIPNVGVTGRHFTNFVMIGQHSVYDEKKKQGYWKDRCIDLDFQLLTKVFNIKPEEISFLEDVWVGPNAFGYSLEYYVRGLELGNAVFTEFIGTPDAYSVMKEKIIDMGAGLERFAWITQGTPTCYDAVFGVVMKNLMKNVDYDKKFWTNYIKVAGRFNVEDFHNYKEAKSKISKEMGLDADELIKKTAPVEAMYAIADHAKTILFAVADGGLPSNVGGGYNLRVIMRRALSFIEEFNFDIDFFEVCRMHSKQLKEFNPRLKESLNELEDIISVETERHKSSKANGQQLVESLIKRNIIIDEGNLIELYESHGVTPEAAEKIANKSGVHIEIPSDFYTKISENHMKEKLGEAAKINLASLPDTRLLFYEDQNKKEFTSKVLRIIDSNYVVLDQTAFYGRAGGQQGDTGFLNGCRVYDTEKYGTIIVHLVEKPNFSVGDTVHGKIDWPHREQLMRHHTTVHVVHGAAHELLGNHVWQSGANKTAEKAHIDITHYKALTDEEVDKIEDLANNIVKKAVKINKYVMTRHEAEKRFGFTIYQGGAIPQNKLRIIEIPSPTDVLKNVKPFDVEACSGTHCSNTREMNPIVITSTERIQDGAVRITIMSADAALKYLEGRKRVLKDVERLLGAKGEDTVHAAKKLFEKWKQTRKKSDKMDEQQDSDVVKSLEKRVKNNVLVEKIGNYGMKRLQGLSKIISKDERVILLFGLADKVYVFGSAGAKTNIDMGKIVKNVCEELGGKGGGTKGIGQGFGTRKEKLNEAIDKLRKELTAK